MKREKIEDLNLGDLVRTEDVEISRVKECVHGNKYYAYCGDIRDVNLLRDNDFTQAEVDNAQDVQDSDLNLIPCCG